jgi:hypothetical protein
MTEVSKNTICSSPALHPLRKTGSFIKRAVSAIDEYTRPREETKGDLVQHSLLLGCNVSDGISVLGVKGLLGSLVAPAFGVYVANKTGKTAMGIIAGAAMAAALGAGASLVTGCPMLRTVIFSALLGTYETFRGNPKSETRDAASGANIVAAPFISGPLKLAGGVGAALATKMKSRTARILTGAATSAVIGAAIAAIGMSPVSLPVAVTFSALSGAAGPFFGPRYSQFFRNLSNDIGKAIGRMQTMLGKKKESDPTTLNIAGAVPASIAKEAVRTFALSDGSIPKTLFACTGEALKQGYIFWKSARDRDSQPVQGELPQAGAYSQVPGICERTDTFSR